MLLHGSANVEDISPDTKTGIDDHTTVGRESPLIASVRSLAARWYVDSMSM